MGGQQPDLGLAAAAVSAAAAAAVTAIRTARPPRPHAASEAELAAHKAMVDGLKEAIWLKA